MAGKPEMKLEAGPEQLLYASILEKGMLFGLIILFITFGIYAFGIMKPYIPLEKISAFWGMSVHDYIEHTKVETGWRWVGMLSYGDFINFIGIAILAGVTIICYFAIIPTLLRNKDRVYALLALIEAVVLGLAASGLLAVGH